jgi:adenine C2-methylase RlmN of 23S rRNA A2503 and tRNA A37
MYAYRIKIIPDIIPWAKVIKLINLIVSAISIPVKTAARANRHYILLCGTNTSATRFGRLVRVTKRMKLTTKSSMLDRLDYRTRVFC